jgi:DNA repair exonuclease SbcCD ATPase subunit
MIKKVYHISDIHIRNYKRHFEYRAVFYELFNYLSVNSDEHSIIVVTGDIVHSKTDLSPDSVQLMGEFFRGLANIMPTYVICGNHDANLANKNRLDSISPVIDQLNHPNLFYWKFSGVHPVGENLVFSVMSVFDDPEVYLKAKDVKLQYPNRTSIALYHGVVSGAKTDLGFVLERDAINLGLFRGYDMVMLGDVHKTQFLDKNRTVAYPGSLIQQDFGESLFHGLLEWDVQSKDGKFIQIDNDFGYYTIDIKEGHITNSDWKIEIPRKARVRFELDDDTTSDQLSKIIEQVSNHTHMVNSTVINKTERRISTFNKTLNYSNINDPEYQNYLIEKYALKQLGLEETMIKKVKEINREINKLVPDDGQEDLLGVVWKPIKFQFSNMFTYGENNVIEFDKMKGLLGIFAKNAYGKSSIFSSLVYCMFDKCSRTSKASDVINNKSDYFSCTLQFSLDNKVYYIERIGRRQRGGNVKVNVNFYFLDSLGNRVILNGKLRSETNKIIREYIGDYDDFILTSMSLQDDYSDFVRSTQKNRKTILSKFSNLGIFEKLHRIAGDVSKEHLVSIKLLENKNLEDAKLASSEAIETYKSELSLLERQKKDLSAQLKEHSDELDALNNSYTPIKFSSQSMGDLMTLKSRLLNNLDREQKTLVELENSFLDKKQKLKTLQDKLSEVDLNEVKGLKLQIEKRVDKERDLQSKIKLIKLNLTNIQDKVDRLEKHEYDPNCEFCIKNPFVKDATQAASNRSKVESDLSSLLEDQNACKVELKGLQDKFKSLSWALNSSRDVRLFEAELKTAKSKVDATKSKILTIKQKLATVNAGIVDVEQYENIIAINDDIEEKIKKAKARKSNTQNKIEQVQINILEISKSLSVQEERYSSYSEDLERLKDLNSKFLAYKNYLQVVKYDGLPTFLIGELLPILEGEVNAILSTMVDFSLLLEVDSSQNIKAYVSYGNDTKNRWSIEMGSGMEKFISSLAIRVALIKNSNIPRPNFLGIDEGFGSLDAENVSSIGRLFEFLRNQFDFILCISHVTNMRDMVDGFLDISRTGYKSKIIYEG